MLSVSAHGDFSPSYPSPLTFRPPDQTRTTDERTFFAVVSLPFPSATFLSSCFFSPELERFPPFVLSDRELLESLLAGRALPRRTYLPPPRQDSLSFFYTFFAGTLFYHHVFFFATDEELFLQRRVFPVIVDGISNAPAGPITPSTTSRTDPCRFSLTVTVLFCTARVTRRPSRERQVSRCRRRPLNLPAPQAKPISTFFWSCRAEFLQLDGDPPTMTLTVPAGTIFLPSFPVCLLPDSFLFQISRSEL